MRREEVCCPPWCGQFRGHGGQCDGAPWMFINAPRTFINSPWMFINGRRVTVPPGAVPDHLAPCAGCGRLVKHAAPGDVCGDCLGSVCSP